ncbi:MAG: LamG domain-containing protein [Acidimicrobiia bacterium]
MADDQVTIDPEFLPPSPGDDQTRHLRAAGVVGVVVVAFVLGWFLRPPEPIEGEPDRLNGAASTTFTTEAAEVSAASTTTRPSTTTTTSEPPEAIRLAMPLGEAMPGFTDVITMEEWTGTGVDVVRWRPSQSAPETIASFGSDDGFAGLDTSGTWYAIQDQNGVLSVHRVDGGDAGLVWFPDLQAVGVRVASQAWHDTEPGQLAWLTCSRTPGGPGTLLGLDVADGTAEPVAVRQVETVCSEDAYAWLQQWGDWGYVLGISEGESHESVLLDADGSEINQVGDDSAGVWFVAGHPDGSLWTRHDSSGLRSSSFLLSSDGQSSMPVPGLAEGEWLDSARWSPDGTRLALSVRQSDDDNPLVRIVDPRTAVTIAEIAESDWEIRPEAWSTDSRFLLSQRWLCPDGCGWVEPQEQGLAFYDAVTGTTTVISLPTPADGGWGGTVHLTDATIPAELVAHYPLDGDAADLGGYLFGSTVVGAILTSDRFGVPDAAYAFDGENDRIVMTTNPQLETDTVSIAAWIKMNDAATPRPVEEWWDIVSYGGRGHVLAIQGEGAVLGGLQGTAADCEFMGSDTVLDGNWHHVAMTRDANWTIRVYLDGVAQAVTPHTLARADTDTTTDAICTVASASPHSKWIGADPGHREYFHGSIDDVRIYAGTLTDDEIATLAADTP